MADTDTKRQTEGSQRNWLIGDLIWDKAYEETV
jgi:hypothetical protein